MFILPLAHEEAIALRRVRGEAKGKAAVVEADLRLESHSEADTVLPVNKLYGVVKKIAAVIVSRGRQSVLLILLESLLLNRNILDSIEDGLDNAFATVHLLNI